MTGSSAALCHMAAFSWAPSWPPPNCTTPTPFRTGPATHQGSPELPPTPRLPPSLCRAEGLSSDVLWLPARCSGHPVAEGLATRNPANDHCDVPRTTAQEPVPRNTEGWQPPLRKSLPALWRKGAYRPRGIATARASPLDWRATCTAL